MKKPTLYRRDATMDRYRIIGGFMAFFAMALLSAAPFWAQGMKGMMKPMAPMGGMKMPANAPTVPPVTGYSEG